MEHSALHALLLTGLIAALGGALAMLAIVLPALRKLDPDQEHDALADAFRKSIARWVFRGALAAALASGFDLFVQVAELEGRTVFGGADLGMVARFATQTSVGQLALLRIGLLVLTAAFVRGRTGRSASSTEATDGHRPPLQTGRWLITTILALGAVVATGFVGHAAAQPEDRAVAIAVQIAHLLAASGWIGILLHLFASRGFLLADPSPAHATLVAELVRRFSPLAFTTTGILAATGLAATARFLGSSYALFTSAYGLTLLVKLGHLAPAVFAGWVNFRRVRPQLSAPGSDRSRVFGLFSRMLELEITAGVLVVAVAGILASISPPGTDGALQLTAEQTRAVFSPDLPTTRVQNWTAPEDPRGPTEDDLRYSEFTHNWAGVLVILLGLGWLAQGGGGRWGVWASRGYPLLLVPFGIAISVLANPELWIMRTISPWTAFTNPALLEHQLAAVLVFLLAWLSWRDRGNADHLRPLGYALPLIMIAGSLLLLGHAHSDPSIPNDLSNLINVQHTIFGACGLFAGTTRWFVLRGLISPRIGNLLWPAGIIALGLFMAFFYREVL